MGSGMYPGVFPDPPKQTPSQTGPTPQGQTGPDLYGLTGAPDSKGATNVTEDSGFFKWAWNVASHWMEADAVKQQMDNPFAVGPFAYNPPAGSRQAAIKSMIDNSRQNTGETLSRTFNDYLHLFGHIFDHTSEGAKQQVQAEGTGTKISRVFNALQRPETYGRIAEGLFQPVADAAEISTGLSLTGDDMKAMTPEEKSQRIEDLVGFSASIAVGGLAAKGLEALGTGAKIWAAAAQGADAIAATEPLEIGGLGVRILNSTAIGAVSGAAYGAFAYPNNPKQAREIIANAFTGGVAGAGITSLSKLASMALPEAVEAEAFEVRKLRETMTDKNSIASQIGIMRAAPAAKDLTETLLAGKVPLGMSDWKIPGIDPADAAEINSKTPKGFRAATYMDKSGKLTYLIHQDTPENIADEPFFTKTGFTKGEQVTYLGKANWTVEDVNKAGQVVLKNMDKPSIKALAARKDIRENIEAAAEEVGEDTADELYDEWEGSVPEALNHIYPLGPGETPPTNIVDRIPEAENLEILNHMKDFLASKGYSDADSKMLLQKMQANLAERANAAYLGADDKAIMDLAAKDQSRITDANTIDALRDLAQSNKFDVDESPSGRIIVRDLEDRRPIRGFDSYASARDWINQTGQATGPKLDGNAQIETSAGGGNGRIPPNNNVKYPQDEPYDFAYGNDNLNKSNWGEEFIRYLSLQNSALATKYRDYFLNIDRVYDTKIGTIYDNASNAINRRNAAAKPYVKELQSIQQDLASNPDSYNKVRNYIDTMSPDEVATKFLNRPLHPAEIAIGKLIAENKIDLDNLFRYRRELENLDREFPKDQRLNNPRMLAAYQQEVQKIQQGFSIGPKDLRINDLIDRAMASGSNMSVGAIIRYAQALDDGSGGVGLSRAAYAAKNNMSAKEVAAGERLSNLYDNLSKVFGVRNDMQYRAVVSHANKYYKGDLVKAVGQLIAGNEQSFYNKIARTGEISAFDTNPFRAALRFIKAGFDVQSGFQEAMDKSGKVLNDELKKIDDPGVAARTRQVATRFLSDIRGFPAAVDQNTTAATKRVLESFGLHTDKDVVGSWASAIGRVINFGALGFRPMLGMGHLGISAGLSWAARNASYTRRMLINGAEALRSPDTIAELQRKGVFRGISPYSAFADDETGAFTKAGKAFNAAADAAFKATGLPTVYDGTVAGHYITTFQDALEGIKDLNSGKITADQFNKKLFLTRYDLPVVKQFKSLAARNAQDAAHYLGMQAVEDLVGTYGRGNTPYKWGSTFGRLAGQYGSFSRFTWAAVARMASRGTVGERLSSIAKLAALQGLWYVASQATGVDLTRMSPLHAMFWLMGPAYHDAEDVYTAVHGQGLEQALAKRRLERILPIDTNGNFHPNIFVPGSFAVDGIMQALDDADKGNYGQAALQALGFRRLGRDSGGSQ